MHIAEICQIIFVDSFSFYILLILLIFRLCHMHTVRKVRPIAADVAHIVVCVYVCWSHGLAVQKRLNRSICILWADSYGSKEPCIR